LGELPEPVPRQVENVGGASWLQVSDIRTPGDNRPVLHDSLGPTWDYTFTTATSPSAISPTSCDPRRPHTTRTAEQTRTFKCRSAAAGALGLADRRSDWRFLTIVPSRYWISPRSGNVRRIHRGAATRAARSATPSATAGSGSADGNDTRDEARHRTTKLRDRGYLLVVSSLYAVVNGALSAPYGESRPP